MPDDQMLCRITCRLGVLVYLGRQIKGVLFSSFGELPVVCMVRTRIPVPPLA